MRQQRGFTLTEMMVVLTICLSLMLVVLPIFTVSTKTVQNVEEKLAVYEAARNILDVIEKEIQQTMLNERGEHFSIKHVPYQDTDPFTPTQGGGPLDTTWYQYSRREACVVDFSRPQCGVQASSNTYIDGALTHPLNYPVQIAFQPQFHESWYESIRSTLYYPPSTWVADDTNMVSYAPPASRTQLLADVGQPEISMYLQGRDNEPNSGWNWMNEPPFRLAPGNELTTEMPYVGYIDQYTRMHIGGMSVMDFNVAYWNDVDGKFYNVDDYMVVYFNPPPKAVRLTVTVCDTWKRKHITLSRIVQIPVGVGNGRVYNAQVYSGSPDTVLPVAPIPTAAVPAPPVQTYNRDKDLRQLIIGPTGPKVDPNILAP